MTSVPADTKSAKLSFAKIAATGLRSSSTPGHTSTKASNNKQPNITSAPRDGVQHFAHSNGSNPATRARTAAQAAGGNSEEKHIKANAALLQVHVHNVDGTSQQAQGSTAAIGLLAPASQEDSTTQVSSSSGSAKPSSLDGKSVASGTTFALDEKESLRPDDSASVKAADDEDVFSPPSTGLPANHDESQEGVRAFHDQLREISSMEPPGRGITPLEFRPPVNSQHGVLYVPPQGLGVGLVPSTLRGGNVASNALDPQPDPKLLEALDSPRDRVWVLKLEQDVFDFVKDAKEASLNLPQCNAYHRMLAHKIADYYMLGHIVDDSASAVRLFKTPECRIAPPLTGITAPSTAASTPPPTAPQMKILRRGDAGPAIANGSNIPSKSTSETGDSEDDKKSKLPKSREEREARYEAARLRIMGSSKPAGSPDELKLHEDSRSSSAAGKKYKKKQRPDSDDGFEARSAYFQQSNAYYTPPYGSNGFQPTPYDYPNYPHPAQQSGAVSSDLNNQMTARGFQPYSDPAIASVPWAQPNYPANNGMQQWPQAQQPGFDLASNFQQAMSIHSPAGPTQAPHMASGYENNTYQQHLYGGQQVWPQHEYPMQPQSNNALVTGYQQRPTSSSSSSLAREYAYQFGQLPSQTFPGRPASKLEHPLPGSYKGKFFNPQSQTFVPGQQGNTPFATEGAAYNGTAFGGSMGMSMGMASPIQRQASVQSQHTTFGSPHHSSAPSATVQHQHHPMIHPLPQPVFPQQPSPNLPLPPKPNSTPQKLVQQHFMPPVVQNPSSIHKWGAPASLPAKPPPPTDFDPARFAQLQRQPSYNIAAAARVPSGGMPNFGSMPPMAGGFGGMGFNGQGGQRQ